MKLSLLLLSTLSAVIFTSLIASAAEPSGKVTIEKTAYGGWSNCIRMTNGKIELIATTDVGPRVIRFGFPGGENEFFEDPNQLGQTGGDGWKSYGGHRLWHGPESHPRSYIADNSPVKYTIEGSTLSLVQDTEKLTGIQKEIHVTMDADSNHVRVEHILTNRSLWPVELAPWGLTVMPQGGVAIFPQEPYGPHPGFPDKPGEVIDQKNYLPVRNLVLWSYTKLNDPRLVFLERYIILKQDPKKDRPEKIGLTNAQNWGAYARNGHLFVKKAAYQSQAKYPDNGCNFEAFTCAPMLELETLGPMTRLEPQKSVTHTEDWYLFDNVKFDDTDESIDKNVLPKVKSVL